MCVFFGKGKGGGEVCVCVSFLCVRSPVIHGYIMTY